MALVQRGRNGGRAPLPRPFLSDGPGLSPGMARGPLPRVPQSPADASGDTSVPLHSHLLATFPLGSSLSVHALRWAAAEASDRAHRRPVLWRCAGGNCHGCLPTLEHLVANKAEGYRPPRFMTEVNEMSKYLVVTHQTALSPDLQRKVSALVAEDPASEFAVLVPEAPGSPTTWEGETVDVAGHRAEAAKTALEEKAGARVTRTAIGASDPLQAIADELLAHPGYDTLVISTFPPGISRWLKWDLVHRAERKFGRRVIHVVAKSDAQERNAVKFIPAGYHSVTAYLTVADG